MSYETIKSIKGHMYGYRVESYRKDGKVRQRILEYHGRLDKVEGGEDIEPQRCDMSGDPAAGI